MLNISQIKDDLWALDELERTTMFVVKGRERAMLLDTGFGTADLKATVHKLVGDMPLIVVNSHAHPDHNGGNNQFDTVCCGRWDEPANHAAFTPADRDSALTYFLNEAVDQGADFSGWNPGPARRVLPLEDGEVIDLGGVLLRVLEIPGHTPGSIALFDEANRRVFTGDMMLTWIAWGHLKGGPGLQGSAMLRYYARSLEKLRTLQDRVDMVLPSHGKKDNPYGFSPYFLPSEVISAFADGVGAIVSGKTKGDYYPCFAGDGLYKEFSIGGIAYDPERV